MIHRPSSPGNNHENAHSMSVGPRDNRPTRHPSRHISGAPSIKVWVQVRRLEMEYPYFISSELEPPAPARQMTEISESQPTYREDSSDMLSPADEH